MSEKGFQGGFRQSMAWLHTWASLVLSVVLYFVFVTGTVGYFNYEIDAWMTPELSTTQPAQSTQSMVEAGLRHLEREAPEAERYLVSLPNERQGKLLSVFAALKEENAKGERRYRAKVDPVTSETAIIRDTGGGDALYRMHYLLHYMPRIAGRYLVGVATLFMLLAIVTGIVVHKKIFKDFFTLRLHKGQRSWLDSHNLSSVLALPFMLMITYSGLLFYTFDYSPGVAVMSMGISQETRTEMVAHLRPGLESIEPSGQPAEGLSLAAPIAAVESLWGEDQIRFVELSLPGDAAARIRIGRHQRVVERSNSSQYFDAATGVALAPIPAMPSDAVFQNVFLGLHEGRFATYPLRWLYFFTGLLGAAMIATGLLLWASKRRARLGGKPAPASLLFVERTNISIIVGLPIGVAVYFWANRLLPLALEHRAAWEMNCLFIAWGLCFMHAGAREQARAWREQVSALAVLFLLLPVVNGLTTSGNLFTYISQGDWVRASFDLTAIATGICLCLIYPRLPTSARVSNAGTGTAFNAKAEV